MWDTLRPPSAEEATAFYDAGWWRAETFLDDLARNAAERPDHPAVIGYAGGSPDRTLTWAQYAASVTRCAAALTELGVGRGDVVAAYLPNRWLLGPLFLACARIGAVSSPVIPVLAERELAHVLDASRAVVCVTVDSFGGVDYDRRLAEVAPATLKHRVVVGDAARTGALDFDEFFVRTAWEQRRPLDGVEPGGADDPVLLLYTSGTTGEMKAVVHSQNTLYAAVRTVAEPQRPRPGRRDLGAELPHPHGRLVLRRLDAGAARRDDRDAGQQHRHGAVAGPGRPAPDHLGVPVPELPGEPARGPARAPARHRQPAPDRVRLGAGPAAPDRRRPDVFDVPLHTLWGMTENGGGHHDPARGPGGLGRAQRRPPDAVDAGQGRGRAGGEEAGRLLVRGASQCLGYLGQRDLYGTAWTMTAGSTPATWPATTAAAASGSPAGVPT